MKRWQYKRGRRILLRTTRKESGGKKLFFGKKA
jgi:hypothetical protein